MNDFVLIQGLRLPVRIGCGPGERTHPQTLEISLAIGVTQTNCLLTGNPDDSVCYLTVCNELRSLTDNNEWPLLEQLAEDVAKTIFERFSNAQELTLEVRKFVIPSSDWVGIRMLRRRQ